MPDRSSNASHPKQTGKDPNAVALGRKGGEKGGPARMKALSAQERSKIAREAAKARWGKKDK